MSYTPIPKGLLPEFLAELDAADDDDAPDGAWWQILEDTAAEFIRRHKLRGCANSATHQWVRARFTRTKQVAGEKK
jgi:hypothetical protein